MFEDLKSEKTINGYRIALITDHNADGKDFVIGINALPILNGNPTQETIEKAIAVSTEYANEIRNHMRASRLGRNSTINDVYPVKSLNNTDAAENAVGAAFVFYQDGTVKSETYESDAIKAFEDAANALDRKINPRGFFSRILGHNNAAVSGRTV